MFYGEYQHTLDSKGRIIMPSKFRDELGESFIITKGLDRCLFVYTISEWEIFNLKMKDLPISDDSVRSFVRFFFGGASECCADSQGRVNIPQYLREYAGLVKNITSIGLPNRVEIWSRESLNEYNEKADYLGAGLKELAAKMALLGV